MNKRPNSKRDSVARLAKTDFDAALRLTASISDVGKRIQALGWVARYAPAQRVRSIVRSAVKIAHAPTDDAYASVLSLAWPLRALCETENIPAIPQVLDEALNLSPDVTPTSSRAEALVLLIHAVFPAGIQVANPAIDARRSCCRLFQMEDSGRLFFLRWSRGPQRVVRIGNSPGLDRF